MRVSIQLKPPLGLRATETPPLRAWQKEVEDRINERAEVIVRDLAVYGTASAEAN